MSESNERNPMQILYVILCLLFAIFCAFIKYKGYSVGFFCKGYDVYFLFYRQLYWSSYR